MRVYVDNASHGSYLFGILVPIIPVFFLPNERFSLDETKLLQIRCSAEVDISDAKFFTPRPDGRSYVVIAEMRDEYEKLEKLGKDTCAEVFVTLPNKTILKPIDTLTDFGRSKETTFIFDIKGALLKDFSIHLTKLQLNSERTQSLNLKFDAVLEDRIHYNMPSGH